MAVSMLTFCHWPSSYFLPYTGSTYVFSSINDTFSFSRKKENKQRKGKNKLSKKMQQL